MWEKFVVTSVLRDAVQGSQISMEIKTLHKVVDIIEELATYNKLSRWQKIQNWFRVRMHLKPIENIVINKQRERVLKRRIRRLTKNNNNVQRNNNQKN